MTSIILAGGENRRFPFVKSTIQIGGKCLIERILEVHKPIFNRIVISTNSPELYFRYGVALIGDVVSDRGPMTGILSCMIALDDEWFFVSACDMPFLNGALIKHIISIDTDADAIVPIFDGHPQPLNGMYNRRLISYLYGNIMQGKKGMKRFLSEIKTCLVEEDVVRTYDPDGKSFININTLDDLNKIEGGSICLGSASRN